MSDYFGYDPVLVLSAILKRSASQVQTPHGFVGLVNPTRDSIIVEYGMGLGENYVGCQLRPEEGVAGYILRTGYPQVIPHYQRWDGQYRGVLPKNKPSVGMVAGTPVWVQNQVMAVLTFIFEAEEPAEGTDLCAWLYQVGENASHAMNAFGTNTPSDTSSEMMPPPIPA